MRSVRARYFSILLALVALGLGSRLPVMPAFVLLYVGDVLWGAMFFALYACLSPTAARLRLWALALATTELIELSQLYRGPLIEQVRATALGGLLLGHVFLWSDVFCVALGVTTAAALWAASDRLKTSY